MSGATFRLTALADMLRAYVEERDEVTAITEGDASFVVDLLTTALGNVNWDEIADDLLSDIASADA